jgi:hypothetical protein
MKWLWRLFSWRSDSNNPPQVRHTAEFTGPIAELLKTATRPVLCEFACVIRAYVMVVSYSHEPNDSMTIFITVNSDNESNQRAIVRRVHEAIRHLPLGVRSIDVLLGDVNSDREYRSRFQPFYNSTLHT